MNENKFKKLASNSILFAIGNFGSKFISFFMLPLYTYQLSTKEFGIADLILTTVSLLLPIVALSIYESVFRFVMEKDSDIQQIFSNGLFLSMISSVLLMIILFFLRLFKINYATYVMGIIIFQLFQVLFSQFTKAIDEVKIYTVNGILVTLITVISNIILLVIVNLGISGYLISIIIANLVSCMFLWIKLNLKKYVNFSKVNKEKIYEMLLYSIPLIPNSIALWVNNVANRYFILYFIGPAANGIFAVANKIPTLLGVINSIFFQAWQLSAIEEFKSDDSSNFYSKTFSFYSKFLFLGVSCILAINKIFIKLVVSDNYVSAWKYVPFLLLSILYSSFSGFFGQYYIAAKKTFGVFSTTIIGAVINLIANVILIPTIGLTGAGLSSSLSFFVIWMIRQKDTQKMIATKIDKRNMIINHMIIMIQIFSTLFLTNTLFYFTQIISVILSLFINRESYVRFILIALSKYKVHREKYKK